MTRGHIDLQLINQNKEAGAVTRGHIDLQLINQNKEDEAVTRGHIKLISNPYQEAGAVTRGHIDLPSINQYQEAYQHKIIQSISRLERVNVPGAQLKMLGLILKRVTWIVITLQ